MAPTARHYSTQSQAPSGRAAPAPARNPVRLRLNLPPHMPPSQAVGGSRLPTAPLRYAAARLAAYPHQDKRSASTECELLTQRQLYLTRILTNAAAFISRRVPARCLRASCPWFPAAPFWQSESRMHRPRQTGRTLRPCRGSCRRQSRYRSASRSPWER